MPDQLLVDELVQAPIQPKPHQAPPANYDRERYPFGPPIVGRYKPKNPDAKYRVLVGQYVGDDGKLYDSRIPGKDICPETTKHPLGLARWPEKFQRLNDDQYAKAARAEETEEQLIARLEELRARKANPNGQPGGEASTLDTMTVEELHACAAEEEIDLSGCKNKKQMIEVLKKSRGL